jgi:diguanylate cyclase (GGDEF)-like protein/PAS domain S-box-containing protein
MRRKIVLSLFVVFIIFATGILFARQYMHQTASEFNLLLSLHQVQDLRQQLILYIQNTQADLFTVHTPLAQTLDSIVNNVTLLEEAGHKCTSCHHKPEMLKRLNEMQSLVHDYQMALSHYITASANEDRVEKLKFEAAGIGNRLLILTENMSFQASKKLEVMTDSARKKIATVETILTITIFLSSLLGIIIVVRLTMSFTKPIYELVKATRAIASGDLGYTISYNDKTEFGELASHFNTMSAELKHGYENLQKEIEGHKETSEALSKSETFLNTIFDSIRDPFCIIDNHYRIIRVNQAYAAMKNNAMDKLVGGICYEKLHGRSEICDDCIVEKTFHSGDTFAKEKLMTLPDGEQAWIEIYTYPILASEGAVAYVIEYSRDITERKKAEDALIESRERYALAARGANDGLWDWDLKTNLIYFSPRWKSMLGFREEDIGNGPEEWLNRVQKDDRKQLEAKISAHINGNYTHLEHEYRIMHKDGTYCWMLIRGLAVRDGSGRAYRMAGSQTDITERKVAEEQMLHDAFHDGLTGLSNRALFMNRLQHAFKSVRKNTTTFYAVLFLDLDRFKVINDSLGHTIGDQLLIAVSKRLLASLRPSDTIARIGGDEFAILLENLSEIEDATLVVDRIQKELLFPFQVHEHEVFISTSIGIALSTLGYNQPEHLLRDADIAMYQAKAKGRGCYEVFDAGMHTSIVERLRLETDLRHAVEGNGFILHYQPIMDLTTERVMGFEALVRWKHPTRGLIPPLEFIPLAEEIGLIVPLGQWILKEACRQAKEWQEHFPFYPPLKISVNISSKQFSHPDLLSHVAEAIRESGIDPSSLALEVTESMIMENAESASAKLIQLREMGVHIHIDDFGTGYSSLSYINRFPVNALKIDRSFVNKMTLNEESLEIVRAIVSLALTLNLEIVAEGLEMSEHLKQLKELKCHYGQGYLFSKPMDARAVSDWIAVGSLL